MIDIDISYIDTLYSILILLTSLLFTNCIYLLYSHLSFYNYISFTRLFDNNFSYNLLKYSFDINTRLFMFLHNCNIQYLMFNIYDVNYKIGYSIILALELTCIFNIYWIIYIQAHIKDYIPGYYINNNSKCPICLVNNNNWILPCKHKFHKSCIKSWFDINSNCPLCRKNY